VRTITIDTKLKLGNFALSFTDLTIPFAGFPLSVVRKYDTLQANQAGEFGYGWQLDIPNTNLQVESDSGSGTRTPFEPNTRVTITMPDGSTEAFYFSPQPTNPNYFGWEFDLDTRTAGFVPADLQTTSTLSLATRNGQPRELVQPFGAEYYPADSLDFNRPYNPARFGDDYLLTTRTGVQLLIDSESGDLLKLTDRNGNSIFFNGNGITSDTGVAITFDYEWALGGQRIRTVHAPNNKTIEYRYNDKNELISVTNRAGEITSFEYEDAAREHYLTDITSPRGVKVLNVQYDPATGRVTQIADAGNQTAGLGYNLDLGNGLFLESVADADEVPTELVRDAAGNTLRQIRFLRDAVDTTKFTFLITLFQYDGSGNKTRDSQPFTYDDPNTRFSFVPADLKWAQTSKYDTNGNVTSITDALGNKTFFNNYDEFGNPGQIIDPLGNKTTNVYDTHGNLQQTIDAEGNLTTFGYDDRGLLETVTQFKDGTPILASQSGYDTKGRLATITDAVGFTQTFDYDAFNEVISSSYDWVDPAGVLPSATITTYTDRDDEGRVIGTRYEKTILGQQPDELWHTTTVYIDGMVTSTTDRFDVTTASMYDARGNLIETRTESRDELGNPTWIVSRTVYDDNGRVIYTIDPHVDPTPDSTFLAAPGTHSIYDSLGRVIGSERIDLLLIKLENDLDHTGLKFTPEPLGSDIGNTLSFDETIYDAVGRVDYTRQNDGADTVISKNVYDVAGRLKIAIQDPDGNLLTTTDQLTTQYIYDAAGRQTRVIDALGRETRYEYDKVGRQVATISPAVLDPTTGTQVHVRSETVYDDLGRRVRAIENITQTNPDVASSINRSGQRITEYAYDNAGRLTSVTLPAVDDAETPAPDSVNPVFVYQYDQYGNQTLIRDPKLHETKLRYDEQQRQVARELPNALTETKKYDDLGQLELTIDFEGRHTRFSYDSLGRLEKKESFLNADAYNNGTGAPSEFVRYTYDGLGRQTKIVQDGDGNANTLTDQRVTTNTFDTLGRLRQECGSSGGQLMCHEFVAKCKPLTSLADACSCGVEKIELRTFESFLKCLQPKRDLEIAICFRNWHEPEAPDHRRVAAWMELFN
jgi:YD repeat-containing protein